MSRTIYHTFPYFLNMATIMNIAPLTENCIICLFLFLFGAYTSHQCDTTHTRHICDIYHYNIQHTIILFLDNQNLDSSSTTINNNNTRCILQSISTLMIRSLVRELQCLSCLPQPERIPSRSSPGAFFPSPHILVPAAPVLAVEQS